MPVRAAHRPEMIRTNRVQLSGACMQREARLPDRQATAVGTELTLFRGV